MLALSKIFKSVYWRSERVIPKGKAQGRTPWTVKFVLNLVLFIYSEWRLMAATVFHTFCLNAQRILIDHQKIFIGDDLQNKSKYQSVDFY
jgi:hypothetical protein